MVIVDTGAWLALANPRDRFHGRVRKAFGAVREPLVTTLPVLTEATHLLLARLGTDAVLRFMNSWAAGAFRVFDLTAEQVPRVATLMKKYADLPMDLVDASLVILAEALEDGRIISTDCVTFEPTGGRAGIRSVTSWTRSPRRRSARPEPNRLGVFAPHSTWRRHVVALAQGSSPACEEAQPRACRKELRS